MIGTSRLPRRCYAIGLLAVAVACVLAWGPVSTAVAQPSRGTLVLVGGGDVPPSIAGSFVRLAGGHGRRFVYIPTAAADADIDATALEAEFRSTFGVDRVAILHTRDRRRADSADFVRPIEEADAVWFGGGRQWRIADAYLGTRTEAALRRLLARGGVIGGTSAGASILASYLVRGAPEGNWIVDAPGHRQGFGLLPDAAVDQHVDRYRREDDIAPIVRAHPEILGIGLDEATGLIVAGGIASVIGDGRVILHDEAAHCGTPYLVLRAGNRFKTDAGPAAPCAAGLNRTASLP